MAIDLSELKDKFGKISSKFKEVVFPIRQTVQSGFNRLSDVKTNFNEKTSSGFRDLRDFSLEGINRIKASDPKEYNLLTSKGFRNSVRLGGQLLQRFPETKVEPDIPETPKTGNSIIDSLLKSQQEKLELGSKITSIPTSLSGEQVRDYGRTAEKFGEGKKLGFFDYVNISDFVPGFGLIGFGGVKSLEKQSLKNLTKEEIEKLTKEELEKAAEKRLQKETVEQSRKYAFNINKVRLAVKDEAEKKLDEAVELLRPTLEDIKGKPITKKEIIRGGRKAELLDQVLTREESLNFSKQLQASRNFLKTEAETPGVRPQFLEQLKIVSSTADDAGRRLKAFDTGAENVGIKEKVLKDLVKLGNETEDLVKAGENVDWTKADQVTEFYRKFKPAEFGEKLTEYRYVNMLSSPFTHIVNTISNFIQTAILAPTEKVVAGGIDWTKSALTKSERKYYASQGVDYAKGYWRSLPEAWDAFKTTFKEGVITKPDVDFIPSSNSKLSKLYRFPLRALEASDQFFKKLTAGGETKSLERVGIKGAEAEKIAEQSAEYRLFRQTFDPQGKLGQNKVLQLWDKWNAQISRMRNLPSGKWIVPFLQTPTNILKQGVEYSPLGISTVPGSKEPIIQLSKAIIGSSVFLGAWAIAESGSATWDAPIEENAKREFYAAGLQPYSIKIGNKWVSYSKLGALSYPIAMAAAMKWSIDNGGTENDLLLAGKGMLSFLQFFSDQSYVSSIGNTINGIRGENYRLPRLTSNIVGQLVPYRAFLGWMARTTDPVYRKSTTIQDNLKSQIPFLSKQVPAYETPFGEQSTRDFPLFNSLSPFRATQDKPELRKNYEKHQSIKGINKLLENGKVPTKGKLVEDKKLLNVFRAEYVKSQLDKASGEERPYIIRQFKEQGILDSEVSKAVLKIAELERRYDLTKSDRELFLYTGKWKAFLIYKRLGSFTNDRNRRLKIRQYERVGILNDELVKQIKDVSKSIKESEQRKNTSLFGQLTPKINTSGDVVYLP